MTATLEPWTATRFDSSGRLLEDLGKQGRKDGRDPKAPETKLYDFVRSWLSGRTASTLAVTKWGPRSTGSDIPDRRYDMAAAEADVLRCLTRLDRFHRVVCWVGRTAVRQDGQWRVSWKGSADRLLRQLVPYEWQARIGGDDGSGWYAAFEAVVSESADQIAGQLGTEWHIS